MIAPHPPASLPGRIAVAVRLGSLSFALATLAACGKTDAPPTVAPAAPAPAAESSAPAAAPPPTASPATAAAPAVDEEMKRLAGEVYVFAYPMVLTEMTRLQETARGGLNAFQHRRGLPDAASTGAPNPNADFLYSQAWLDLSKEPVILSVPDTKGRYYLIAMLDAWSNVAASLGKRTIGTEKREFAIVGPRSKAALPEFVTEVKSPTEMAWLFGRIEAGNKSDLTSATRLQDEVTLTPLSEYGKRGRKPAAAATAAPPGASVDPAAQVAAMDASTFLTHVAMLLPGNPPTKDDAPMLDKIRRVGLVAGQPFDPAKLAPLAATSVQEGVRAAHDAIEAAAKRVSTADVRNGWSIDRDIGRWGADYGKRAVSARRGLGVNAPEDAIFMVARFDAGGQRFDGAHRYVLHFDKGALPPVEGFWSLSLYNDQQQFAANPAHRFTLGSVDKLKANADGSMDLVIQKADPGGDANWLPAPAGGFNLVLRAYWPKADVLEGRWAPPGVRRLT